MSAHLIALLRKHADRIKAECGYMATLPEICADLRRAADTIEELERHLLEAQRKLRAKA